LPIADWESLASIPVLAPIIERLRHFQSAPAEEALAAELAARLYSPILRTSVSRMEASPRARSNSSSIRACGPRSENSSSWM